MILRRDGASRSKAAPEPPSTVASIGQSLAAARVRIGLSVDQAATNARATVPEIQALESGDLRPFADRVDALRTLRHYADSLGLDGDKHVVALLDCWSSEDRPADGGEPTVANGASSGAEATGVVDHVAAPTDQTPSDQTPFDQATTTSVAAVDDPGAATLANQAEADEGGPSTMLVPATAAATTMTPATPATGSDAPASRTGQVALNPSWTPTAAPATAMTVATPRATTPAPVVAPVTGVTPAVTSVQQQSGTDRTSRASAGGGVIALRVLVALLSVLVVVGLAGLVVHHWRPTWWTKLHLPAGRVVADQTAASTAKATTPTTAHPIVSVVATTDTTETVKVRAASYGIDVAAVGGASWMQATDSEHTSPVFSGVLQAGQSQLVTGTSSLTVEVGSSAGQVQLLIHQAEVATYKPHVAPYTYVFQLAG